MSRFLGIYRISRRHIYFFCFTLVMDVGTEVHGRLHHAVVNVSQKGMKMHPRWLLPFTHGVDMRALEYLVSLAEHNRATLIPVSLVSVPEGSRAGGARLERIQQSKDFLEAVKYKAARYEVPVERYEVFTSDVMQSITALVHDLHCDGIVMVAIEKKEVLLRAYELKQLLVEPPAALVLIRLPSRSQKVGALYLGARFFSRLLRLWRYRIGTRPMKNTREAKRVSQIKTGEEL